jgi:hypothetical protein
MGFAPRQREVIGEFVEKSEGHWFQYTEMDEVVLHPDLKTGRNVVYPHKLWVTHVQPPYEQGWRRALVKGTVAYVVVDETDEGFIIEKWNLKGHRKYSVEAC